MKIILSFFVFILLGSSGLIAQVVFEMDDQHRGVLWIEKYQIYPEKRFGNGLYRNKRLLVSDTEHRILEISDISEMESVIYLYDDSKNNQSIGLYNATDRVIIKRVDQEFYELIDRKTWSRKIYRIYKNHIQSVFPASRTATGLTPSKSHVAFYHIMASEAVGADEEGKEKRQYTFRIHVIRRDDDKPYTLRDVTIQGFSSYIRLAWLDATKLQYTIDGKDTTVDVKAEAPQLFR